MFYRMALLGVLWTGVVCPLAAQTPIDPGWDPVPVGQEITFTNTSWRGETFAWDFDYNSTFVTVDSTAEDGVWTYFSAGQYAVRLEVCNPLGCDVVVKLIQVENSGPAFIFSSDFESGDSSEWNQIAP